MYDFDFLQYEEIMSNEKTYLFTCVYPQTITDL